MLAPIGFVLPPAVGAVMISLSTIVVAANAQLLRRVHLRPGDTAPPDSAGGTGILRGNDSNRREERV